jgi:hypothetical protein
MYMVYIATAALAVGAGEGLPVVGFTSLPPVEAAFVQGQGRGQGQTGGQAQGQGREQRPAQPPAEARGRRDAAGTQRASGNDRSGAQEPRGRAGGQQAPGQARGQETPRGQAGQRQPPARDAADRRQEPRGRSAGQPGAATGQGQPAQARGRAGGEASAAGPGSAASSRAASSGDAPGMRRGDGRITQQEIRERVSSLPAPVRRMGESRRRHEAVVGRAAALGTIWGLAPASLVVRMDRDVVRVANRRNELLLDLDERRARDLGAWELSRIDHQRVRGNAPSFCRTGEGHPVWGREWCIRQGFGLGSDGVIRWSRAQVGDVIYRRHSDRTRLDRVTLIDVLGDVVFGRLALHALGMGYDRPLSGVWIAEPAAPRILRIYAGDAVVAEMVDLDRNDRVDVLYVAHRL